MKLKAEEIKKLDKFRVIGIDEKGKEKVIHRGYAVKETTAGVFLYDPKYEHDLDSETAQWYPFKSSRLRTEYIGNDSKKKIS